MLHVFVSAVAAAALVWSGYAVAADDPPPRFPPLRFTTAVPLLFNVGEVVVVDRSATGPAEGRIDDAIDLPPAAAVSDWAAARLVAAGRDGNLTMVIREASVTERPLAVDGGLSGVFKDEETSQLSARLVVDFVATRANGSTARATVSAFKDHTLLESDRAIDRRQALYDLTRDLIASFDAQASTTLDQHFASFR